MRFSEIEAQIRGKRRTIKDLERFISTRTDQNPNYTLFLGAGCSVTSGVRSASTLSNIWRDELYKALAGDKAEPGISVEKQREFLKINASSWYDPSREYSSLFEKKFDLQRQRRMFVETEVSGKWPSIGYAYLVSLVKQNYFNTIFTTNFDDLVNEAFYSYSSQRPIVCAHDSSINSVTVTSKRPKIIKLHGDYLFDDLKSTMRETESLEQNMKSKFVEFAKDYGLIVVGYAGGDRSIMDALSSLLKSEDYFKGGIYWCLRRDADVSEELRKLLWKERVYFVEVPGFDEIFADLYCSLNPGEALPLAALSSTYRSAETASRLLASPSSFPTTTPVLQAAWEKLSKHSKRSTLANLMVRAGDDKASNQNRKFTDDELILLTEVNNLVDASNYQSAIELARQRLREQPRASVRRALLNTIIQGYRLLCQETEAIGVVDELIRMQPKRAAHYLLKAQLFESSDDVLKIINQAIDANPYSVRAWIAKGRHHYKLIQKYYGEERAEHVKEANSCFEKAIELDPSNANPSWGLLFDLIHNYTLDSAKKKIEEQKVIDKLTKFDPFAYPVLTMRARLFDGSQEKEGEGEALLKDLREADERLKDEDDFRYAALRLQILSAQGNNSLVEREIISLESRGAFAKDTDLTGTISDFLRGKIGDDRRAIDLLKSSLQNGDFDAEILSSLIHALIDVERLDEAKEYFQKYEHRITSERVFALKSLLLEAEGNYKGLISEIERYSSSSGLPGATELIYAHLKAGDFGRAEQIAREYLEPLHYTPEADVQIINLELARKRQGRKCDSGRLEKLLNTHEQGTIKIAVHALLNRRSEMYSEIRKEMSKDKTFRYSVKRWPLFDEYRQDADFIQLMTC